MTAGVGSSGRLGRPSGRVLGGVHRRVGLSAKNALRRLLPRTAGNRSPAAHGAVGFGDLVVPGSTPGGLDRIGDGRSTHSTGPYWCLANHHVLASNCPVKIIAAMNVAVIGANLPISPNPQPVKMTAQTERLAQVVGQRHPPGWRQRRRDPLPADRLLNTRSAVAAYAAASNGAVSIVRVRTAG